MPRYVVLCLGLIALVLAITWSTSFNAPFGDNHEGRVDARFALQVENVRDLGFDRSGWGSSMAPYGGNYAHHPPGPNAAQALISLVPGEGEHEVRLFPYAMGLLTLAAAAWLLRTVGTSWVGVVGGVAALAVTPMFWAYGRLLWDIPFLFAIPAATISLPVTPSRRRLIATAALVFTAVLMSWIAAAFAAVFVALRLHGERRLEPRAVTALVGAGLVGAVVTVAWILAATNPGDLTDQVELRASNEGFTVEEFLSRQGVWVRDLYPLWLVVLVGVGIWIARRTPIGRLILVSGMLGIAFVVVLRHGAFIHDYWSYPLLVPIAAASAAALEVAGGRARPIFAIGLTVLACVGLLRLDHTDDGRRFERREDAGRLARGVDPPDGQATAWVAGDVTTARWLSLYWGIPARPLDERALEQADADEMVVTSLPLSPRFVDAEPLEVEGDYAIVTVGELRRADR